MKEVIVKLNKDHVVFKGGEYVRDLVRCKDCIKKYSCITYEGLCDDDAFCSNGES